MNLLINKKILVTKSRNDSNNSFQKLIDAGANIIYLPTIKIIPLEISDGLKTILCTENFFDYIIFTSSSAVKIFCELSINNNFSLGKSKIAVVGKRTAEECTKNGLKVDVIPQQYSADGLILIFSKIDIAQKKILIPCSKLSNDELKNGLTSLGADVKSFPIYDVRTNEMNEYYDDYNSILINIPDVFIFTSPSSFKNYLEIFNVDKVKDYFFKKIICVLGKTTANEIISTGLRINIQPAISTLENVTDEIINFYQNDYAEN